MKQDNSKTLQGKANKEKDVTTEQGANMETVKQAIEKTPVELANERKQAARKAAKAATVDKYNGNPAALLIARKVNENKNGKQKFYDFEFSWTDENGKTVTATGAANVTACMSRDAAKAFNAAAARVQGVVVNHHNATEKDAANIRTAAKKDIDIMFTYMDVTKAVTNDKGEKVTAPRTIKHGEVKGVLDAAYFINANGDDDADKELSIIKSVCAIARRVLHGREQAINADKARKDAAAKAKAEKEKAAA